jgi:hypothetical protein
VRAWFRSRDPAQIISGVRAAPAAAVLKSTEIWDAGEPGFHEWLFAAHLPPPQAAALFELLDSVCTRARRSLYSEWFP